MNQVVTHGIILSRLNYGEADKIITVITPDHGKIRLMARGVRKVKSKLAGGIELFSISTLVYIPGKKDISTLVSTRLITHFNHIVEDLDRTMIGYDILKITNKATEDECDSDYYELLLQALTNLNDKEVDAILTKCWFMARLLKVMGHSPNIAKDTNGQEFSATTAYNFDYQAMGFYAHARGSLKANHIKMLRLLLSTEPHKLQLISGVEKVLPGLEQLLRQSLGMYIKI